MTKIAITCDLHKGFSKETHNILVKFFDKIVEEKPDILLIAGDLVSHKPDQLKSLGKLLRTRFDIPILVVKGNHDFWGFKKGYGNYDHLLRIQNGYFKRFDIHYLSEKEYYLNDCVFFGYDGWYKRTTSATNDHNFIVPYIEGLPFDEYFARRAFKQVSDILEKAESLENYKKFCMTHFNLFPINGNPIEAVYCGDNNFLEPLCEVFDYLIVGHDHQSYEKDIGACKLLNAGSHYNAPRYKIVCV